MIEPAQWISFKTIVRKEVTRFLRIWPQTLLPPLITTSLYFLIFGSIIGRQIKSINGIEFIKYITPGLIMMALIMNSYLNVCSSFYTTKFQRSVEELLVSPTSPHAIICGYVVGGSLRAMIIAIIIFFVANAFSGITLTHSFLFIIFSLLTSVLFSLTGLINGILANKFDDISIIPTFVLTPLSYLGGIFYSIDQLPPFWKSCSLFNPIYYLIDGLRYSLLGVSDINVIISLFILLSCILGVYSISFTLLSKGFGLKS